MASAELPEIRYMQSQLHKTEPYKNWQNCMTEPHKNLDTKLG